MSDHRARLRGRVALVTGANHGIGAATAVELASLGADVVVTYLRLDPPDDEPGRPAEYARQRRRDATAVLDTIAATGARAAAVEADLADADAVPALFDRAEADVGPVDILVHNASGWRKDSFSDSEHDHVGRLQFPVTADSAELQLMVDARGGALLIAELARRLRDRHASWGRIVTLTSGGSTGFPGEASYGAAKAALENYTMTAATELASLGVTANAVYPPVTDTGWVTDQVVEFVARSPQHVHVAPPADVASVIGWLCTDAADLVTGNVIRLR